MRWAYAVTTWGGSRFLNQTLDSIPAGSRLLKVDVKPLGWPLARAWNYALDTLINREDFDAAVVMNDDVVLRQDTGYTLAAGLLYDQWHRGPDDLWTDRELLLLSARHAAPSDACTDVPDWALLEAAQERWQPGPDFACFCAGRRLLEVVGGFDENFDPCHFEDNDMHRRIQLAGFEAGAYAPYWHFRNGTTRSDPERRATVSATFEGVKDYYCRKWGAPNDERTPAGRETFERPFGQ